MKPYEERNTDAMTIYQQGKRNLKEKPQPKGQKFPNGSRVELIKGENFLPSGTKGTVVATYAHLYPQINDEDIHNYCLNIDGEGEISWFTDSNLKAII